MSNGKPLRKRTQAERDEVRRRLFDQQRGLCHLCGKPMSLARGTGSKIPRNFATFDHVIPKVRGGTAHLYNLKVACNRCNSERGHKMLLETVPVSAITWEPS